LDIQAWQKFSGSVALSSRPHPAKLEKGTHWSEAMSNREASCDTQKGSALVLAAAFVLATGCNPGKLSSKPDAHTTTHDSAANDAMTAFPDRGVSDLAPDSTPCVPQTLQLTAEADTYVDENNPSSNFGDATELLIDQGPDQQALLRFTVANTTAPVTSAKLRLNVTNSSSDGPAIHLTSDPWDEATVTWDTRPMPDGAAITDLGNVDTGWLLVDVTSAVTGDGSYAFLLIPGSSNGMDFGSKEGGSAPELVVTTGNCPQPPPDSGPPPGDGQSGQVVFSFFAVGDTRSNPNIAQQNFQSMSLLDPTAIALFNSGDLTADGEDSQWQDHVQAVNLGSAGKIRMDMTGWSAANIRYFGIIGNHDIHDSNWLANWNKYLPGQQGMGHNGSDGVWFSATYGNALFIVLDSHHSYSTQTTWLQQELAAAAANPAIKWKFVFFHRPVYPCNYKSPFDDGVPWVREFEQYGVDMVFTGHAHVYERTCAMVGGQCQQGGVVYVISGGGGAGTGDINPTKTDTAGTDSYDCSQILQVGKSNWHHYCHLQINDNTLSYDCYPHTATTNPEDSYTIVK
jgi:hypothetical protein